MENSNDVKDKNMLHFQKKKLKKKMLMIKKYPKVRDHCHYTG